MAIKIIKNDMYIRQKDSALINIVFDDGVDITDFIILFTVKVPPGSDEIKIQKIITQHDDPLNGITSIKINSEDTDIERRTYRYNIIVKTPDNQEHTIYPPDPDAIGKFYVERTIQ